MLRGWMTKRLQWTAAGLALAVLAGCGGDSITSGEDRLSRAEAESALAEKLERVSWRSVPLPRVTPAETPVADLAATLPDISTFPLAVSAQPGPGVVEIFVSTEKSGDGPDGWMKEAALAFNRSGAKTPSGATARVSIRKIASGTAYQFIGSGKRRPDAFSPSNALWIKMAEARGAKMTPIAERTVSNIAGVVMKKATAEKLRGENALNVPGVIDGVVLGKLQAGYTDPYASSTGLNFLTTVLSHFSGGDNAKLLAAEAVSAFETFQARVPFVAHTTLQMRDSVRNDGALDAFVMEWQTFANIDELRADYEFVPFGWPHDNPLYAVGDLSADKMATLELFGAYLTSAAEQEKAARLGFNPTLDHAPPAPLPSGDALLRAQKLWREKKDGGRPIAAVFIADVSGSMDGARISQLRRALIEGSSFITAESAVGLIEFSTDTRVVLPIKPFTGLNRAAFQTAVRRMSAGGNTAMYNSVAVGLEMLVKHQKDNPDVKPMLFALTDGETNEGLVYSDLDAIIAGLGIPVVTIGFEANIAELKRLSATVEAASIQANEADVRYKIGSIFNSQLR